VGPTDRYHLPLRQAAFLHLVLLQEIPEGFLTEIIEPSASLNDTGISLIDAG
jgi:hypothetical protein